MSTLDNIENNTADLPKTNIGILGGTFDPIHFGHIKPAEDLAKQLALDHVVLMPTHIPPHKNGTHASSEQRKRMVELVCQSNPLFIIDDRELQRTTPSFTIDSIREFRSLYPDSKLFFFIGSDSLNNLPTWHKIEQLLELCHFVVSSRPGHNVRNLQHPLFKNRISYNLEDVGSQISGKIVLLNTCEVNISSTELRERLKLRQSCQQFMPEVIIQFIEQNKLYQD